MTDKRGLGNGLQLKIAATAVLLIMILPGIAAMETDPSTLVTLNRGGETLVVFDDASRTQFDRVVDFIQDRGGRAYALNPPHLLRAHLPAGIGVEILNMPSVRSVTTEQIELSAFEDLGPETHLGIEAWNLAVRERRQNTEHLQHGHHHDAPVTSISDRSGEAGVEDGPMFHHGMAQIYDDIIACEEDSCTNDMDEVLRISRERREEATVPVLPSSPLAPHPGPSDTSEFMLGSIGVAIILPESNGSVDSNSEDWTGSEQTNVINEVTNAFNWWSNRMSGEGLTVGVSFSYTTYLSQATSYEPISRRGYTGSSASNMWTWMNEIQGDLGYANGTTGGRALANHTRAQLGTDWGYVIWVVDSSADGNNQFTDNTFGFAALGGPYVVMTYGNDGYGIGNMDAVTAHETGHIFYALDEYSGPADSDDRSGYLNCINGNAQDSGNPPPQTNVGCIMRGGTSPYSNNQICGYTKGQIGWNDTDADNIPDILDTKPKTTLDSMPGGMINVTSYIYYGNSTVQPLTNRNPYGWGNSITLNTIAAVEWRLDSGAWQSGTAMDGAFSNHTEAWKATLTGLSEGSHTIQVRARNDHNNEDAFYANETFLVDVSAPSSNASALPQYMNIPSFDVGWSGDDGSGSGLAGVQLWYRRDSGPWKRYGNLYSNPVINFTHEGDGYYEFYTIGVDNVSNIEGPPAQADADTTVETTPPNSSIGTLPEFTNQTEFDLNLSASDDGVGLDEVEVFYRKDGGSWNSLGTHDPGPVHFVSSGDGTYDFHSIARDTLGNEETAPSGPDATITVDTRVPETSVTLDGEEGENGWNISSVEVEMSTDESAGHLEAIYYRMDNGTWNVYNGSFSVGEEGYHELGYHATDLAGNVEEISTIYFKIDSSEPHGSIVINDGNDSTLSPLVEVDITVYDNVSGVTGMMISEDPYFSGAEWIDISEHVQYNLSDDAGIKTLHARFKNGAGIESGYHNDTIILDSRGPMIAIDRPADNETVAKHKFEVEGTARDNVDIDRVELSVEGSRWVLCDGKENWSIVVSVMEDGIYSISARTFDLVGNSARVSITVTVDASLPTVVIETPEDNSVTTEKRIPVEGSTDPGTTVRINNGIVDVDDDGNFSTLVSLREGANTITLTLERPAGTMTKEIRVTYVHPPIVITDLEHFPLEPKRTDTVRISCVVPGDHIVKVELKYRMIGGFEETMEMTRGEGDVYEARIGPYENGGTIEYYVVATDDVETEKKHPDAGRNRFTVPREETDDGNDVDPEEDEEYGLFGYIFLGIVFAIIVVVILLSMRGPKTPPGMGGPRKVSDKTAVERIDPRRSDRGSSGRRGRDISESKKYRAGEGVTRFRDDDSF